MIGDTSVCNLHVVKVVVPIGYSTTPHLYIKMKGNNFKNVEEGFNFEIGLTFGNTCLLLY